MAKPNPQSLKVTGEATQSSFTSQLAEPLAVAAERLGAEIKKQKAEPNPLFGHHVKIKFGKAVVFGDELDVEFEVPFDDDPIPNEAEIVIYNLSTQTLSDIRLRGKKPVKCVIEAGYKMDVGILFSGTVKEIKTRWEEVDRKTTIIAVDDGGSRSKEHQTDVRKTYSEGTTSKSILKDLIIMSGLPLGTPVDQLEKGRVFKKSVTVEGDVNEQIVKYAAMSGVQAYISRGTLYLRSYKKGSKLRIPIGPDTGMIGSPEEITKEELDETVEEPEQGPNEDKDAPRWERPKIVSNGFKVTTLLDHRIVPGVEIVLKGRNARGRFKVRSGTHRYDGTSMTTEVEAYEL